MHEGQPLLGLALTLGRLSLLATGFFIAVLARRTCLAGDTGRCAVCQGIDAPQNTEGGGLNSPLESVVLFYLGPVPITQAIVTTWVIMAVLVAAACLLTRQLALYPTKRQAALELIVTTMDTQIVETSGADPAPYRAFIGTLFLFILVANWSSLIPGVEPPTAG